MKHYSICIKFNTQFPVLWPEKPEWIQALMESLSNWTKWNKLFSLCDVDCVGRKTDPKSFSFFLEESDENIYGWWSLFSTQYKSGIIFISKSFFFFCFFKTVTALSSFQKVRNRFLDQVWSCIFCFIMYW